MKESMAGERIDIAISYRDDVDADEAVAEFASTSGASGLNLHTEGRPDRGPIAGVEWLLPTAVVVYIAKSYFDSFLREAGKDHYHILKRATSRLANRIRNETPRLRQVYSAGKVRADDSSYSQVFSIYGEIKSSLKLKLLVHSDADRDELELANAFIEAVKALNAGDYGSEDVVGLDSARPIAGIVLVAFDPTTGKLVVVDPLPKQSAPY